jgi:hypothetical protein
MNGGGNISSDWSVEHAFAVGDQALQLKVLEDLYTSMKDEPANVDLKDLWRKLGVKRQGEKIVFDDTAPLAKVRLSINAGRPAGF